MLTAERGEGGHLRRTPFLAFPDVMDFLLFLFVCFQFLSILPPSGKGDPPLEILVIGRAPLPNPQSDGQRLSLHSPPPICQPSWASGTWPGSAKGAKGVQYSPWDIEL